MGRGFESLGSDSYTDYVLEHMVCTILRCRPDRIRQQTIVPTIPHTLRLRMPPIVKVLGVTVLSGDTALDLATGSNRVRLPRRTLCKLQYLHLYAAVPQSLDILLGLGAWSQHVQAISIQIDDIPLTQTTVGNQGAKIANLVVQQIKVAQAGATRQRRDILDLVVTQIQCLQSDVVLQRPDVDGRVVPQI